MATVISPSAADGSGAQAKSELKVQATLQELGIQPLTAPAKVTTTLQHIPQKRSYASKHLFSTQTAHYYLITYKESIKG